MLSGASTNIRQAILTLFRSLPRDEQEQAVQELADYHLPLDYRDAIKQARKSLDEAEGN